MQLQDKEANIPLPWRPPWLQFLCRMQNSPIGAASTMAVLDSWLGLPPKDMLEAASAKEFIHNKMLD